MAGGAGILFAILSLAFAWLLWTGRGASAAEPERAWRLRLRSAIPPLMLIACIPSGCQNERFDALRLTAGAMVVTEVAQQGGRRPGTATPGCEAYFASGDQPVFVVGRARGCTDLIVADPQQAPVEGALVRLDQEGQSATLRLATTANASAAMIVGADGAEGRSLAGAIPIADGDQICLNACTGADARWWTLRNGALEPPGGGEARALTVRGGLFGWIEPYGPTQRINRLASLLCPNRNAEGGCESPALADPRQSGAEARPALSFLFQEGGWRGHGWRAMLVDAGAAVRRADGTIVRPDLVQSSPLGEGERRRVAILGMRGDRLSELRSFTLGHRFTSEPSAQRSFRLALDTPEQVPIGSCTAPLSRLAVTPDQVSAEAFSIDRFGNRPNSVLASAAASLPIDRYDLCQSTSFSFRAPLDRPADDMSAGAVRRQIEMQVDRMGIPWLLVWLAAAVALIVHVASERTWRINRLDGILLGVLQYLLVVRAMIGIEGVFADPALEWRLIYGDVGMAMVALPAILIAVRRRGEIGLATLLWTALFVVAALAALWWWLGPPDWIARLMSLIALGALGVRALTLLIGEHGSGARWSLTRLVLDRDPAFWWIVLLVIVVARITLGLLGFRERLFGLTLSAIYIPLFLACIAAIIAQAEAAGGARRGWFGMMFLGALGLGIAAVAIVINDVGFALVHVPPIAGVALWRLLAWVRSDREAPEGADGAEAGPASKRRLFARLTWAAPAAALVIGYLGLWALIALTPPPGEDAPLEQRVAYAIDDLALDPNWLRLRAVYAPQQIAEIGTRNAAIQLDQSQLLGDLTGTMLGRGWLTPVDLGSFRYQATHLSDYLSASHIMAPFGRLGAVGLLFVLAAAAGAAVSGRVPIRSAWPTMAGALAMWTLFGAAAYMILANLLLVPFTGRNIYLLAASSGGDLIEGLGLLLMARFGLGYGKNQDVAG